MVALRNFMVYLHSGVVVPSVSSCVRGRLPVKVLESQSSRLVCLKKLEQ